jgi:hypothetical protein
MNLSPRTGPIGRFRLALHEQGGNHTVPGMPLQAEN